jgi:methylmalonyl-CoA mutase cobalamin-binding subunit
MWAGGRVQDTINSEISTPLRQALVSHVIPQLIDTTVRVYAKKTMLPAHSVALGQACLSLDHAAPEAYARSLLAQDFDIESLYQDTIPETARLFHDWWEADDIDFIQVTNGIFRLEELVYSLSAEFVMGLQKPKPAASFSALLVRPPGSQHSLGLLLLSQYFKRYGWQVFSANQFTEEDMAVAVRSEWVDILGISVSEDRQIPALKKTISRLRKQSGNPHMLVMAGGPLLRSQPNLADLVGANLSCLRADQAHTQALEKVQQTQALAGVRSSGR